MATGDSDNHTLADLFSMETWVDENLAEAHAEWWDRTKDVDASARGALLVETEHIDRLEAGWREACAAERLAILRAGNRDNELARRTRIAFDALKQALPKR